MSHFVFKAKKPSGEIYAGERDLADRFELYRMIRESGDEMVSFEEKKRFFGLCLPKNAKIFSPRMKTAEKINFARNLSGMLEAGLALSRALQVLERQAKKKSSKAVISRLMADIDKGSTFADALAEHQKIFPPLFVSMVHAGEQSGTMADSLKAVATQMENTYTLERRVRGALIYPAVILTVMIIIAVLMFIFVVPTLMKTFTELNVQLPQSTKIILGLSALIQEHGISVGIALAALCGAAFWASRKPLGKKIFHRGFLLIPVIGSLVQEVNAARTARTLSSLLESGVDVVESVSITGTVVQNVHYRAVLDKAKESIKKGELLSKIFNENEKLYPTFFAEMVSVGEETGKLGEMLKNVALFYEADVEQKTKDMSTVIEPFLMIVVGAAVGFFAVSMITPIYSLVNAV